MKWLFETGSSKHRADGKTWQEAIKSAWAKRPPKIIGLIVQMTPERGPVRYVAGEVAVKAAGYECEERDS